MEIKQAHEIMKHDIVEKLSNLKNYVDNTNLTISLAESRTVKVVVNKISNLV